MSVKTERELFMEFKAAKEALADAKEAADKASKLVTLKEHALIEYLEANGANSTAKYDGLGRAQMAKPKLYASCAITQQDALFEFLEKEGRMDLVKESVHPATLSSFVKERIESGQEVPEFINYAYVQKLRIY